MDERKAKPTPADRKAAAFLKARWVAAGRKPSQTALGGALGISQGAVSQYLSGDIPMNFRTLVVFCQQLGIEDPTEVRADLPEQQLVSHGKVAQPYPVSQPARLDPETLRAAHELLRGSYADEGKTYDIEAEPDLLATVYERLAALTGAPNLAEMVSIGRAIEEKQREANRERSDRGGGTGGTHQAAGKKRAAR